MPKISVIVPTYNRADMLLQAIESVFAQTFQDFETIVSDDGSTDNTEEVVRQFGSRVRYLKNAHSGLPSVARNIALDAAQGKYIAFLDSDDLWLPDKLKTQVDVLDDHPQVGMVFSNAHVIDKHGDRSAHLYLRQGQGQSGKIFLDLLNDNFIITSTTLVRRSALEQVGKFHEASELLVGEDYALWLFIALDWYAQYLEEPLICYRDAPADSIRGKQDMAGYLRGMIYLLKRFGPIQLDDNIRGAIDLKNNVYQKHLVQNLWEGGQYCASSLEWFRILFHQPLFVVRWIVFEFRQNLQKFIGKLISRR